MPTREELLESLTYRELKALAREFEIPLKKETRRGIEKATTSDEMIDVILEHRDPTKKQIREFVEDFAREREAKRKLRKKVKCPNCNSTEVEQRGTATRAETGLKASLAGIIEGGRKKIQIVAIYYCKECGETFERPIKRAA